MNSQAVAKKNTDQSLTSKTTGFSVEQAGQFVQIFKGQNGEENHYVKAAGRRWRMDERFGVGRWRPVVDLPTDREFTMLMRMWGMSEKSPAIIMKAEIYVDGELMAKDWGTTTPENCLGGMTQFKKRGIELATTRALNRAMGQLTSNGLGDPNERYTPVPNSPSAHYQQEAQQWKRALCQTHGQEQGEAKYYEILGSYGIEKHNERQAMTDPEIMDGVLVDLRVACSEHASDALFDNDQRSVGDTSAPQGSSTQNHTEIDAEDAQYSDLPPEPPPQQSDQSTTQFIEERAIQPLIDSAKEFNIDESALIQHIASEYGCETFAELTTDQYTKVRIWIRQHQPVSA